MWLLTAVAGGLFMFLIVGAGLDWCAARIAEVRTKWTSSEPIVAWRDYPESVFKSLNQRAALRKRIEKLDRDLILAGRGKPWTGEKYLSVTEAAAGGSAVVILVFGLLGRADFIQTLIMALLAGGACWMLSGAVVQSWIAARQKSISREFPYFLDLAVMTMGAGATFLEALDGYGKIARSAALVEEIRSLAAEISMGTTMETALAAIEVRLPAPEVVTVIRSIRQGLRMGTPLNLLLQEQAEQIRFKRSQMAERGAEELKVKLQGPTMLLMISVLLLVLGPVIVGMTQSKVF